MTPAPLIPIAVAAGLVVAQPAIPPPPQTGDAGALGAWLVYVLIVVLVAGVVALWRAHTRLRDRLDARESEREQAIRDDAASRVELAGAMRDLAASAREQSETNRALAAEIRACPARANGARS